MSTLTNEPITVEVDNTEDWVVQINDTDLEGQPISHVGETMVAELKDAQGNLIFTVETGDELSILGGTTNGIMLTVPWSIVKNLPGAEYYATLVTVLNANSRKKIIDLVFRHEAR